MIDRQVHDVTMPIYNGMWRYRSGWDAEVTALTSTARGDASTVYRFHFCSHTGTYLETSQHKLANNVLLDDFAPDAFVRPCKVIVLETKRPAESVLLGEFKTALTQAGLSLEHGDSLIIATGWGLNHRSPDYLEQSPFFDPELVDWLAQQRLHLLGVDVPAIDSSREPYGAVHKLFVENPRMLLLAPLVIDPDRVKSGHYVLTAAPLKVESVSASLCRALLLTTDFSYSESAGGVAVAP